MNTEEGDLSLRDSSICIGDKIPPYLQGLSERNLTQDVLVPLLLALGFERVDYYGGPYEKGKDLICWRTDELGQNELAVAQVKNYRPTPKASSTRSFMEVVNQLQQATEHEVPGTDGRTYLPNIVYFITPHPVDTRSLEARFSKYSSLRARRVKIIDGPLLSQLLRRHLPELVESILGIEASAERTIRRELNNQVLLRALDAKKARDLRTFYADPDISLGGDTIEKVLRVNFSPRTLKLNLIDQEWALLRPSLVHLEAHGISITSDAIDTIDENLRLSSSKKKSLFQIEEEQASERSMKSVQLHQLVSESQVDVPIDLEIPMRSRHQNKSTRNAIDPRVEFSIDGRKLSSFLTEHRDWLRTSLNHLKQGQPWRSSDFRDLLRSVGRIFPIAYEALNNQYLRETLGISFTVDGQNGVGITHLGSSMHDILRSGENLTIIGEAGAGKTTCLQVHALRLLEEQSETKLVLYIPLAPAVAHYLRFDDTNKDWHPISHLFRLILSFLSSKNSRISESDLRESLTSRPSVLLLDGVDEVTKSAPWIIDAVRDFPKSYTQSQIMISARLGTDHLAKLPFAPVALLPFSDQQRERFISDWFKDDRERIKFILGHVKRSTILSEVLRSPLLCTILCVLAENRIPLPSAELRLYQERLRLLLGDYDIYKQTSRLKSHRYNLEMVARRLAFVLHREGIVEAPADKLASMARESLEGRLEAKEVELAVQELENPCNILVPMSLDGGLGFGHLRYQEHLAALELCHNRGVEIGPFIYDAWWKGALIFFAQLTDEVDFLVDWALENGVYSREDLETLEEMVIVGHSIRKSDILRELRARAELINSMANNV